MPRHFSFTIFCFAQVVTDFETTYLGATIVAACCVLVGRPVCQAALRAGSRWRNAPFKRYFAVTERISVGTAVISAFIGTYSHVFLDSIMHADVEPFEPFSSRNPLYCIISFFPLHALCLALGALGTWYLVSRSTK